MEKEPTYYQKYYATHKEQIQKQRRDKYIKEHNGQEPVIGRKKQFTDEEMKERIKASKRKYARRIYAENKEKLAKLKEMEALQLEENN